MRIGKFNDFSKNRKINEAEAALMTEPGVPTEELSMSGGKTITKPEVPTKPAPPVQPEKEKIQQPVETPQRKAYVEEEEGDSSDIETMLANLTEELNSTEFGIATLENNVVKFQTEVDGQKKELDIEFISETMSFTINKQRYVMVSGRKKEMKTIEDVVMYIESLQVPGQAQAQMAQKGGQRAAVVSERKMSLPKASHLKHSHSKETTLDKLQNLEKNYKSLSSDLKIGNVSLPKSITELEDKIEEVKTLLKFKSTKEMENYLETLKSMKQYFK